MLIISQDMITTTNVFIYDNQRILLILCKSIERHVTFVHESANIHSLFREISSLESLSPRISSLFFIEVHFFVKVNSCLRMCLNYSIC